MQTIGFWHLSLKDLNFGATQELPIDVWVENRMQICMNSHIAGTKLLPKSDDGERSQ